MSGRNEQLMEVAMMMVMVSVFIQSKALNDGIASNK